MIRFLSICSGIEAVSVAVEPLGWRPVGFAEIEKFPCEVLAQRFGANMPGEPLCANGVPNHGDFTQINLADVPPVQGLFGGTPCQSFSVAGKRLSLADSRGNLTLSFVALAHELARSHGLQFAVWENVPGVLSTKDNAFGCLLGGLVGASGPLAAHGRWPGAGMVAGPKARAAWRVLDAQYFGLAQRRKRVFLVVSFGKLDPARILFERQGLRGNSPPRRQARQDLAPTIAARARGGGGLGKDFDCDGGLIAFGGGNCSGPVDVASACTAHGSRIDFDSETFVCSKPQAVAFSCKDYGADASRDIAPTLRSMGHAASHPNAGGQVAVAFDLRGREGGAQLEGPHHTANLRADNGGSSRSYVQSGWQVRRLTPRECERLQGFPDDWTAIARGKKPASECADGPRYKALGNSMAVTVIAWIAQRIDAHFQEVFA